MFPNNMWNKVTSLSFFLFCLILLSHHEKIPRETHMDLFSNYKKKRNFFFEKAAYYRNRLNQQKKDDIEKKKFLLNWNINK